MAQSLAIKPNLASPVTEHSCSLSKMNNVKNAKDFQFGTLIPSIPTEQPKEEEREVKDDKVYDRLVIPCDFVPDKIRRTTSILDITPHLEKWYIYLSINPQTKDKEVIATKRCRNCAEEMRLWVKKQNNKTTGEWYCDQAATLAGMKFLQLLMAEDRISMLSWMKCWRNML
jgi:hypothetical protein